MFDVCNTRWKIIAHLLWLGFICNNDLYGQQDFYAYHTKRVHSATDYFGKYADLIVVLGEGRQLEFTRHTQNLPKWVTPKGTYSLDDFYPGRDIDPEFNYNYVRLIEASKEQIVVHWRYVPDIQSLKKSNYELNPTVQEGFSSAVHEFFTIYPNGLIEREVRDPRGSQYESWIKSEYSDRQIIRLQDDGVIHESVSWGNKSPDIPSAVEKSPVIMPDHLSEPVMWWSFDEGGGDYPNHMKQAIEEMLIYEPDQVIGSVVEYQSGSLHPVLGDSPFYKKGVSGTSLGLDGYYTGIRVPKYIPAPGTTYYAEDEAPDFKQALTIEAWLAIDAYPYNLAPIAHQSINFGEQGFYFGIDSYGFLQFTMNGKTVVSEDSLTLYRWTHVAARFGKEGIEVFIDGKQKGKEEYSGEMGPLPGNFMVGLNSEKARCTDYVRGPMQNIPFIFGIQGLIDELKVYDKRLSNDQLEECYTTYLPQQLTSPLLPAELPGQVGNAEKFGAVYRNLEHHALWDRMWRIPEKTDIVVKFENNPGSVVYWRGTNFAANWVTDNNRWMADQSSEIFTKHGCSEHMADKQTRHSYARVIENNQARVVIHWRYPNVDVGYICTDRRNWSDEYHTIYPDGTAVRNVVYNNSRPPGFQDIQFFTNPGEEALDVVHMNAMTVANLEGQTLELVWEMPNRNPDQHLENATIEWMNSKSKWKVYTVFQGPGISTWGEHEQSRYTNDPFAGPWNHWPVSMVPSDGRYAVAHDRVTHFALGANDAAPMYGSMVHYGFTDNTIDQVIPVARYWQKPPAITSKKGLEQATFSKQEKAYLLEVTGPVSFRVEASSSSPLVNPAFVLNTSPEGLLVKLNGKEVKRGEALRVGKSYNVNGQEQAVVWMKTAHDSPVELEFYPEK